MAKKPLLSFDGHEVRARLIAEAQAFGPVHVDWLRFTCRLRNAPIVDVEDLFPSPKWDNVYAQNFATAMQEALARFVEEDYAPAMQARALAQQVADALGPEFSVGIEPLRGMDFYARRWPIMRESFECGWVGFGVSSDSPRQKKQADTIHCNLYGHACTFAQHGWREKVAAIIDECKGWITRIDLALDAFEGFAGGMDRVRADYRAGLMDVRGKRLKCSMAGDWDNEYGQITDGRSFYIGSREAGKLTNIYTKGIEQFGLTEGGQWLRVELRYGNKLRDLDAEMLQRPADFFAGASDWHAAILREVTQQRPTPEPVTCKKKLTDQVVDAAVSRVLNWASSTAGATFAFLMRYVPNEQILSIIETTKKPGRLEPFTDRQCRESIERLFEAQACPV